MRERPLPLAVDLGSTRVCVVAVSRASDGTLHLRGVGSAALEPNGDPGSALRAAVREAAVHERRCSMMVGPALAPLRWIRFPKMPGRERARAARFEGRAALGAPDEPFVVRCRPAPDGRMVLGVVPRKMLDRLILVARSAGLRPERVAHHALILAQAEAAPVLDIGTYHATLALCKAGVPLVRVIPRGGAVFSEALAREFGIDLARAEHRKQTIGLAGAAGEELRGFVAALQEAMRELRRTEGAEISELRVCGNGARLAALIDAISRDIGLVVGPARLERLVRTDLPPAVERSGTLDWFAAAALAAAGD